MGKTVRILLPLLLTAALALQPLFVAAAEKPGTGTAGSPEDAKSTPEYTVEEYADLLLSEMSVKDKTAQLILAEHPSSGAVSAQKKYQYGGYVLFTRDFSSSSPAKMKKTIKKYQKNSRIPMLIAVDEEGGTVVRASYYKDFRSSKFLSPREVYASGGFKGIVSDTKKKDKFLKSLGINTNLAPVADVTYSKNDFMYERAFSNNAASVCKFVRKTVARMNKDNVVSTLKHFPGYGRNGDTHGRIIRDKRSLKTFKKRDLRPFAAGIDQGVDMIMMSHTIVNAFDKKNPVSLSKKAHRYLRNNMKFDGVIITDGLGMKGVTDFVNGNQGEAAVRAIIAGNDMVCGTGNPTVIYKALKKAVSSGRITKSRLNESVRRILIMKIRRGLIELP